jgi:uncharacterized protein DUF4189
VKLLYIILATAITVSPNMSLAAGAVVEGIAPGGAQNGYSIGFNVNSANENAAKKSAMAACKTQGNKASQKECRVVKTFVDQCVTATQDPKPGTPGVGWAVKPTKQEADAEALSHCRDTAGKERQDYCTDSTTKCDGNAK